LKTVGYFWLVGVPVLHVKARKTATSIEKTTATIPVVAAAVTVIEQQWYSLLLLIKF
jgi:hypothetical protein